MAVPGDYAVAPPGVALHCADKQLGKPVRHFTYVNADGEAIVHVDYYDAPEDAPSISGDATIAKYRTYDPESGKWHARQGVPQRTILYRLNEILHSGEKLIIVVPTERDADYLNELSKRDEMVEPIVATTWLGPDGRAAQVDVSPLTGKPVMLLSPLAHLEAFGALAAHLFRAGVKCSKVDPRQVPGLRGEWTITDVDGMDRLWNIMQHASTVTMAPPQPKTARPVGAISAGPLPLVERWRTWGFDLNGQNKPYMNTANAKKYLVHHPNDYGDVWLDQYRQQIRFGLWNEFNREWSDSDDVHLQVKMQTEAGLYTINKQSVRDAVIAHAHEHPLNPYRAYRESLKWDGEPRVDNAFNRGWGTPDDGYHRACSRCFFIQQAMRILKPACQADLMFMFEGTTGIGKTRALAAVFGQDNVASPTAQFGTQKFYEEIQGKAVIEIADLHAFKGAALEAIKAGVTRTTDRFRPAYGRYAEDFDRQCVFVGTTESSDWNEDPEMSARRFPPVECGRIDMEYLRVNAEQLLAEAWARAKAGEPYWDLPDEDARLRQQARVREDAIDKIISDYLLHVEQTTVLEVARQALNLDDITKLDVKLQSRISQSMRKAQWIRKRNGFGRWWEPGPYAQRDKKDF